MKNKTSKVFQAVCVCLLVTAPVWVIALGIAADRENKRNQNIARKVCDHVDHTLALDARELRAKSSVAREVFEGFAGNRWGDATDLLEICVPTMNLADINACRASNDYACLADVIERARRK